MADISVRRKHGMNQEQAKAKVEEVVNDVRHEFSSIVNDIDWNNDKSKAQVTGKGFSGEFRVTDSEVAIDIDLKLFARPFKGKVEDRIDSRMDEYFGNA